MKKTTKVILSSALTMGLCASLIAGSTLAMFSSRSNVNVAITSGKVDVVASVDTDSLTGYSTQWDNASHSYVQKPTSELTVGGVALPANTFLAGGTYTYEAGELKLDSIAPGDAVEFKLNIENNSTLAIQYRVQLTVPAEIDSRTPQGEVVKQLKVSFDGGDPVTIGDESTFAQKWSAPVDKGAAISETPTVRVELPYTVEDEYENQSCLLHVGVYAVQLGTHVADAEGTYSAYTANDLKAIAALAQSGHNFAGETIALGADLDLSPDSDGGVSTLSIALADTPATIAETSSQSEFGMYSKTMSTEFKGIFDGNGFRISNFKSGWRGGGYGANTGPDQGLGLFDTLRDATVKNLILSNVSIVVKDDWGNETKGGYGGVLAGKAYNSTIENITIENSTVVSNTDYQAKLENAVHGHYEDKGVDPDCIGALIGKVFSTTTISNVRITLNEDVSKLNANETGSYPARVNGSNDGTHEVTFDGNKLVGGGAEFVNYVGTSTLVCIPAEGMEERMTFSSETAGSVPSASVEIGSVEGLASLTQSVQGGRDYSSMTITLTDNITLSENALKEIGEFKGTIDGKGYTISGLDLNYFGGVSALAAAASVKEAPTLRNVTLEFTQFTADAANWKTTYAYKNTSGNVSYDASFVNSENLKLENATIALIGDGLRFELHYGTPTEEDNKLEEVAYIGLEAGDPETGEGYSEEIDNQHIIVDEAGRVTYRDVKFTGDTYLNITGGTQDAPITLTVDGCLAEVSPAAVSGNSRAAFIASHSEFAYVQYNITNNTIRSAHSSYDSFSAAIFSWANTVAGSEISNNILGGTGSNQQYTFIAVKLMNFAENADVTFDTNTVYISSTSYVVDTFDLYQNNSRENTYNAYFINNTVTNLGSGNPGYFLYVEANATQVNPGHGQVYVIGDKNTIDGKIVEYANIDPDTFVWEQVETPTGDPNKYENLSDEQPREMENVSYQYNFIGWEVALNGEKKITSGTFVLGAADGVQDAFDALLAEDADVIIYHPSTGVGTINGAYVIASPSDLNKIIELINSSEMESAQYDLVLLGNIDYSQVTEKLDEGKTFTGAIDGRNHVVYGIDRVANDSALKAAMQQTIFGLLGAGSTLKNIHFLINDTNRNSISSWGTPFGDNDVNITKSNVLIAIKWRENNLVNSWLYYTEENRLENKAGEGNVRFQPYLDQKGLSNIFDGLI